MLAYIPYIDPMGMCFKQLMGLGTGSTQRASGVDSCRQQRMGLDNGIAMDLHNGHLVILWVPFNDWLVVWLPWIWHFPRNIGFMSSSQLTNSYFSEGWPNHQPGNDWRENVALWNAPNLSMGKNHEKSDLCCHWWPRMSQDVPGPQPIPVVFRFPMKSHMRVSMAMGVPQ